MKLNPMRTQEDGAVVTTRMSPAVSAGTNAGGAVIKSVVLPSIEMRTRVGSEKDSNARVASKEPSVIGNSRS